MLKRMEKLARGEVSLNPTPAPAALNPSKRWQFTEDFDRSVDWEDHRRGNANYGYSRANHLASAGCAPGEIGGSVSDNAVSWFADNVARGGAMLDLDTPVTIPSTWTP
jgi:hypothetical protein